MEFLKCKRCIYEWGGCKMKRITKKEFYAAGGFSNRNLRRKMVSEKWQYYRIY